MAPGHVKLLLGALGNNEYRLIDVQSGGRVVAMGFRDETPKPGALLDLGPDSAGAISVAGMSWAGTPSTKQLFLNLDGFKGTLAYVGNVMGAGYGENDGSFFVRISGNGRDCRTLVAASAFVSEKSITLLRVWQDTSDPKAAAALLNCAGSGVNKPGHALPNIMAKTECTEPDDAQLRFLLAQLRELRIEPPTTRKEGVTEVKLMRLLIRASQNQTGMTFKR